MRTLLLLITLSFAAGCASTPAPLDTRGITQAEISLGAMTFNARVAGPEGGELVLLLHGFPQTGLAWRKPMQALAGAGYRVVAPDQRGYSSGARPRDPGEYAANLLVDDVLGFADALGAKSFHLAGHDWGAVVAWRVAARAPERVKTLTILSIPHTDAFAAALAEEGSCQHEASSYFETFQEEATADRLTYFDALLVRWLVYGDLDPAAEDAYLDVLGAPEAMNAALNWYRANMEGRQMTAPPIGAVSTDTLFIWSDADEAVCRGPVDATASLVDGPYQLEVLEGADHWILDREPERVSRLMLGHLRGD